MDDFVSNLCDMLMMGNSLIHVHSENGDLDGLNELITQGADVNEPGIDGYTPLHLASEYGKLEIVKVLLAAGAEVNNTNDYGVAPLHLASNQGYFEIVKDLLAAGAEVNSNKTDNDGNTPLHLASGNGHLEIVKVLILAKADVRIKNKYGNLPHEVADTDEIREFIWQHHPWYRRKPLMLTRPHPDHETNKEHQLSVLGKIITATSDNVPSSHDDVLFQLKMKVAEFL